MKVRSLKIPKQKSAQQLQSTSDYRLFHRIFARTDTSCFDRDLFLSFPRNTPPGLWTAFAALKDKSNGTTDISMGGTVLLLSRWDGVNLGGVLKRPRRTLLWALTISSFWGAAGSVDSVVEPQLELDSKREHANDAAELTLFSPQWATTYGEGENGCEQGRGSYTWRPYGFGSNMNSECKLSSRTIRSIDRA